MELREKLIKQIPLLSGIELPWTDYLEPPNPAHQCGVRKTPVGGIEVLSVMPGETGG